MIESPRDSAPAAGKESNNPGASLKLLLTLAMSFGAQARGVAGPYEEKAPILKDADVEKHLGLLGDDVWKIRNEAHQAIAYNRVSEEGLQLIREKLSGEASKKSSDLEILR